MSPVTVLPDTLHTLGVRLLYETANPDVAVAETEPAPQTVSVGAVPKVIVCEKTVVLKDHKAVLFAILRTVVPPTSCVTYGAPVLDSVLFVHSGVLKFAMALLDVAPILVPFIFAYGPRHVILA